MTVLIGWKTGFEIELTAPPGSSRQDLAQIIARQHNGTVRRFFHPQSEPSKVPEHPTFENLTQGFELVDSNGQNIACFVDDLTLQIGLRKNQPSQPGWYRIIADEARLLRLVVRHCDPDASAAHVLKPLADLFGTEIQPHESGMYRVVDDRGVSVAICAPLPGERERPCEIVTAPISSEHHNILSRILDEAKAQNFMIPFEGATHVHFDATPLCSARAIAMLVEIFGRFGDELKDMVGVNTHCVRLGPWPQRLGELTRSDEFQAMDWIEARQAMNALSLSKYCDFNLTNIANDDQDKHTFEIRVLPSTLDCTPILEATALFEALLRWCTSPAIQASTVPDSLSELIDLSPMEDTVRMHWQKTCAAKNRLGSILLR